MIWLVTSHEAARRELPGLIEEKGYRVELFDCTDNLLPRLKFQTPSLIIVDCGVKNGFSVLGLIRAAPTRRPVPVALFNTEIENLRERAAAAGASAYVPKGSLDWCELLGEIVRLAGPPLGPHPRPHAPQRP